jgi:eukaryotic-like serine/threonine-protein kinase
MTALFDRLRTALAGRYELLEELGTGGMAVVYLAHDRKHGRQVAIKILAPNVAASLGAERFLREIALTAGLDHPHILPLLDSGDAGGMLYYVMPYVEGATLRDRLEREHQLPLEDALRITREVADALGYAHSLGVIHRDIKPANILLSRGHARVADFGIARALAAAGGEHLTETGLSVGTPTYMSPEQAAGETDLDGRSDLYSLGCVLYEMLAGEPPHTGTTPQAILAKRLGGPVPSVSVLRETVPAAVDRAVSTALAKAPADRFVSAEQFVQALASKAPAILDAIVAQPASRRWPIGLAVALGGALIVAATWFALGDLRSATGPAGGRPRVTPDATSEAAPGVAVLPFRTVGEGVDELSEGMVDLLSFNFDDVPGLRKIDPHSIMTIWNRTVGEGQETDLTTAVAVAESLGASYALTGGVVQLGDQGIVRLGASVYDVRSAVLLGSTQVEGRIDSLTSLIDRLTIDLLRLGLIPTATGYSPPNLARVTTSSLPALKAYLAGEREYRQGRWFSAAAHFREAVELDSTFARAFYRLGWAMLWAGRGREAAREYLARAATLATGLPVRDSLLLSVVRISDESESALRRLTTEYPDDADGWLKMGEQRFHAGGATFRSPAEYRNAFERAIALAPHYAEPHMHLLDDAFARLDSSRVRSLLGASGMDQSQSCFRLVYDLRWGEDIARRRALAVLDTIPNDAFELTGPCNNTFVAAADETFEVGERAELALLRPESPWLVARVALDHLTRRYLFRGEVRAARAIVARADDHPDLRNVADLGSLTLRLSPYSDSSAASAAHRLVKPLTGGSGVPQRQLWLGLYAIDNLRESDLSASLQELEAQAAADTARAEAIAGFREVLRTYAALRHGDLDRLRDFEAAQRVFVFVDLAGHEGAFLRYDVGRLLLEARRFDDAERYFLSLYPYSWYYVPAQYQLGRVYEALGEREKAREHYRIFVEWWNDADPELQPWVDKGRGGLARMRG